MGDFINASICCVCWNEKYPERPTPIKCGDHLVCHFCGGQHGSGIYLRQKSPDRLERDLTALRARAERAEAQYTELARALGRVNDVDGHAPEVCSHEKLIAELQSESATLNEVQDARWAAMERADRAERERDEAAASERAAIVAETEARIVAWLHGIVATRERNGEGQTVQTDTARNLADCIERGDHRAGRG